MVISQLLSLELHGLLYVFTKLDALVSLLLSITELLIGHLLISHRLFECLLRLPVQLLRIVLVFVIFELQLLDFFEYVFDGLCVFVLLFLYY